MSEKHSEMRRRFYTRLRAWRADGLLAVDVKRPSQHLWQLLRGSVAYPGNDSYFTESSKCTEDELRHLDKLMGGHGYTYYRMLLAEKAFDNETT